MIDLDDEVIEVIVSHQTIAAPIAVQADRAIIVTVRRVLRPGVFRPNRAKWEVGQWPTMAVRPPPHPYGLKCAARRAPSPSNLLALIPPRPRATGIVWAPATSQPRLGLPAAAWIRTTGKGRSRNSVWQVLGKASLPMPECNSRLPFCLQMFYFARFLESFSFRGCSQKPLFETKTQRIGRNGQRPQDPHRRR